MMRNKSFIPIRGVLNVTIAFFRIVELNLSNLNGSGPSMLGI